MPWLLAEDAALKEKLGGLTVSGSAVSDPVAVDVRFTVPEDEFEDFTYPLILLRQAAVQRAPEREHSGFGQIYAPPEGYDPEGGPYYANLPTPHDIDYQVELYTRLEQHRTELVWKLSGFSFLPERFGFLDMPTDSTVRRLDVIGGPEMTSGRDRDNKRLFTSTWRIRVSTELFLLGDPVTFPPVREVDVDVYYTPPGPRAD